MVRKTIDEGVDDTHGGNTEERIQGMLELENDIKERKQSQDSDKRNISKDKENQDEAGLTVDDDTELIDLVPFLKSSDDSITSGSIASIQRSDGNIEIALHTDDETVVVYVDEPDDIVDPSSDHLFSRICDYCGVLPEEITKLQGKRIPLIRGDTEESNWQPYVPKNNALIARNVFRVYLSLIKHIDTGQVQKAIGLSIPLILIERTIAVLVNEFGNEGVSAAHVVFSYFYSTGEPMHLAVDILGTLIYVVLLIVGVVASLGILLYLALFGLLAVVTIIEIIYKRTIPF